MQKVLMYGYGSFGRRLAQLIREHGEFSLLGVIDQRAEVLQAEHPQYRFYTFEGVRDTPVWQEADSLLVSVGNPETAEDIFRKLEKSGGWIREKKIGYAPASRFTMGYFAPERITWLDGRVFLSRIVVHLTDSCNLKCRGCSHFANLFDEPGYDFETMIRDFQTIRKAVYAPCVDLLGGEPLLNPRIEEIIRETRRLFPDSDIEIITNGLLVSRMPESFFETVAANDVRISITMYPPTWEQRDKIDASLRKYRIHHMFTPKVEEFRAPFNPPGQLSDASVAMKACGADYCRFLRNGRLYKCPVAALAYQYDACFGENLLPKEAGINIDATDFHEQALRLCEPVALCRYCAEQPRMQAWKVSTQPEAGDWY